ncbi:hypothetical protein [Dechloromonas sp. HYN0024]|uniref:hypothetical protein n=1 Tax=Dechloromonas sp. HYN0024 TaxID=2231055 RepID=UPI0013C30AEC|nr:hypothetical protein [Dechloromonas sp. HYN0024]
MFTKINLLAGIFAVLLFAYAQLEGWNMFDNEARSAHGGSGGSGGSSRTYHK